MKTEQTGAAAALVGLLMVVAAIVWPLMDDSRSAWSDDEAMAYQEKVARVHEGTYLETESRARPRMYGREPVDPQRLLEHREDIKSLDELTEQLKSVRSRPQRIAGILKWSGAGLVAVGVIVLLAGRSRSS